MKKKNLLVSLALLASMALTGCGGGSGSAPKEPADAEKTSETTETSGKLDKLVIVLPNVRGDGGTHDLACRAAEQIGGELGITPNIVELGTAVADSAKWESAMCDICEEGYKLIITGGSLMKDTIEAVAPQYPDTKFICYDVRLDFDTKDMPNVYSMDFYQNQAAYMAGVVAASTSESGKLGFVGATKIPVIYDFMVGFIEGAKAVNPDIKVFTGFTNDFNDAAAAKELAIAQIGEGADVLFPACGNAATGVYEAAKEHDIHAIGNDQDVAAKYAKANDQDMLNTITCSVMKKVNNAVYGAYTRYVDGTLPFGSQETVGVKEDGAGIVVNEYYEKNVSDEVKKVVEEYQAKISDGSIVVPTAIGMSTEDIDAVINSVK